MKSKSIHDAIVATEKVFVETYNRGDAAALVALYTEDAEIMAPNLKTASGPKALQRLFESFWKEGDVVIKLDTLEADGSGGLAYEVGKYRLSDKARKMRDRGRYIVVWKKVGTKWKLYRDIFNSDIETPPSGSK